MILTYFAVVFLQADLTEISNFDGVRFYQGPKPALDVWVKDQTGHLTQFSNFRKIPTLNLQNPSEALRYLRILSGHVERANFVSVEVVSRKALTSELLLGWDATTYLRLATKMDIDFRGTVLPDSAIKLPYCELPRWQNGAFVIQRTLLYVPGDTLSDEVPLLGHFEERVRPDGTYSRRLLHSIEAQERDRGSLFSTYPLGWKGLVYP
jgi:hypothetical protein